jgi:glycosyltransferase involved in cell wall biosynthesis
MLSIYQRLRLEFEDWLRYDSRVRRSICRLQLLRTRRPNLNDPQAVARTIVKLCTAARLAEDADLERRIQDRIVELTPHLDAARLDWTEFFSDFSDPRVHKAAILKPYIGQREKGVLFISFEGQWIKLLRPANFRQLAERYTTIVAPSYSPPHVLVNYAFAVLFPGPVFTLISSPNDLAVFPRISPNLVVVPLYASSWVNPDLFQPLPKAQRSWDLLMVANFAKFKRHHALFAALRTLPRDLRILLIGQNQDGRDADTIRETARWYGVEGRFTLRSNQPYGEVVNAFCQSRATVVLSKREGSCVAIAESLFGDAPAAMLRDAGIGSRAFINDQTGRFLDDQTLARDLAEFVRDSDRYQPRAWAEQNISCLHSSRILNDLLKAKSLETGQKWSRDIAPLQWSPDPMLVRPEDRQCVVAERHDILERFGLEIGPPPLQ